MKSVSFKVAKAIKEVGYPQSNGLGFDSRGIGGKPVDKDGYSCPTYLDVWLWLWREKDLRIQPTQYNTCFIQNHNSSYHYEFEYSNDPEEGIEQSIEYLVDKNLIK